MTTFADLDVTVSRSFKTTTATIGNVGGFGHVDSSGIEIASNKTTVLALKLPRPSPVTAGFCKEGIGRKLIKLFRKELQTGDATFDDAVYITTDTLDATATWLGDPAVRADILELIEAEATIEISATDVTAELPSHDDDDDPALVRIIQSLLRE